MKHVSTITLVLLTACTDFADVPKNVCGNNLLETGEDCDSDDATCVRCAVACSAARDCPTTDYACGIDGFCHVAGGVLADPAGAVAFQADDFRITDVDRDRTPDVVGVSKTSIVVRHGDPAGSLAASTSFVTPAQSGPPAFGDLDGDGTTDVALPTRDGVVAFTSELGTLAPVAIESPLFGAAGEPLNLRHIFEVGRVDFFGINASFEFGAFIEDQGAMLLVVVDTNPFRKDGLYAAAPCSDRLGAIAPARLPLDTIDIYKVSAGTTQPVEFLVSFLTDTGQSCVMSITGSSSAGFTLADVTPPGANTLAKRPVLADLDNDGDKCPSLVSSDNGAKQLRAFNGRTVNGRCIFDAGAGVVLPPAEAAPADAVAIGRVPLDPIITVPVPPFPTLAPDALVLTSGLYGHAPSVNAIVELYGATGTLAHVAFGDLDKDGDIDAVLATADQDDLDVLYRFPLGLQLFRVDTASVVTTVTLGDFDGNAVTDIAYTETETDHQNMMIVYGSTDQLLEPVRVSAFSGVSSVAPLQFPDSGDTVGVAQDLAVIHVAANALPTMSFLHGSPQRTMLSFFDPRAGDPDDNPDTNNNPSEDTVIRNAVIAELDGEPTHRDLLVVATPTQDSILGMRGWRVSGTANGLDNTPSAGMTANGLSDCIGSSVCVANAEYLAWPTPSGNDIVLAIDRLTPPHAAVIDASASDVAFAAMPMPFVAADVPPGAVVRALHAVDLDGDNQLELVAAFAIPDSASGIVRACEMTPDGVAQSCEDIAPAIIAADPTVTTCFDAAPGKVRELGPTVDPTPGSDLVVLCDAGDTTALFRLSNGAVTPLKRAPNLRAVRVDDVTGDGIDDVVAVAGSGGSRSLVVFRQCSSRDGESCRSTTATEAP
jgi:hypothetical protein